MRASAWPTNSPRSYAQDQPEPMTASSMRSADCSNEMAATAAPTPAAPLPSAQAGALSVPLPTGAEYAGIVTRAIAFVVDAAIVNTVAILTAAATALVLSVIPGGQRLHALGIAIAGVTFVLWCMAYWATFWSTTGQTPGDRMMRIRVTRADGSSVRPVRGAVRLVGIVLAALPLFAGFVPILLNGRRRGLHDGPAATFAPGTSPPLRSGGRGSARPGAREPRSAR